MALYWSYVLADYYAFLEQVTAVTICVILLSSLDDLFIDPWYWTRDAYRHFTVQRAYAPLDRAQLYSASEQPIAIMVPAWQEYDVIAAMIEDMVAGAGLPQLRGVRRHLSERPGDHRRSRTDAPPLSSSCIAWRCRTTGPPARPTA